MIKAGAAYNLTPISMFRSRELQTKLYNNEVAKWQGQGYSLENAKIKAATVVKRPGESEHNTGLTLDILGSGHTSLTESFEKTPAFKWLVDALRRVWVHPAVPQGQGKHHGGDL